MPNARILQVGETISGAEGKATVVVDGNVVDLFELVNITLTVEKQKDGFRVLGSSGQKQKVSGWSGTGTATVRYCSSIWAEMMQKYAKSGVDTYFTVTLTNEDPGSSTGKQVIQALGCNLDSLDIAKLDVDTNILDQDINFTFEDFNILNKFNDIH